MRKIGYIICFIVMVVTLNSCSIFTYGEGYVYEGRVYYRHYYERQDVYYPIVVTHRSPRRHYVAPPPKHIPRKYPAVHNNPPKYKNNKPTPPRRIKTNSKPTNKRHNRR
jgi:hypothetical protein